MLWSLIHNHSDNNEKLKGREGLMIDLYEEKQVVNEMEKKLKELGDSL